MEKRGVRTVLKFLFAAQTMQFIAVCFSLFFSTCVVAIYKQPFLEGTFFMEICRVSLLSKPSFAWHLLHQLSSWMTATLPPTHTPSFSDAFFVLHFSSSWIRRTYAGSRAWGLGSVTCMHVRFSFLFSFVMRSKHTLSNDIRKYRLPTIKTEAIHAGTRHEISQIISDWLI